MKTVEDTQEKGEQIVDQQNEDVMRSKNLNKMMKYPPVLLPLMKSCKNLFLLCSKVKMRLVIFHFKILMILCYLIQKKKRKWKPGRSRSPLLCNEDKEAVHEDEETTHAENIELLKVPAQEETVSYPPLLVFDDALPCDEKEEEDEFSNLANPACYDTDTDIADFDEFIHVGRRRWDAFGYDTRSHL
jgi:hypothetical protein